jgi:hypothetical protein
VLARSARRIRKQEALGSSGRQEVDSESPLAAGSAVGRTPCEGAL